jgi:hypothetical protein
MIMKQYQLAPLRILVNLARDRQSLSRLVVIPSDVRINRETAIGNRPEVGSETNFALEPNADVLDWAKSDGRDFGQGVNLVAGSPSQPEIHNQRVTKP